MSTRKLKNITISQFESFLELCHCKFIKSDKGHAKYFRSDFNRPIIFQNHIDPIPEFIVKNNLRLMNMSKDDFFDVLECVKKVDEITYQVVSVASK